MNQLNVGQSIVQGSAFKKALLLANHIMDVNTGGKGLLTNSEVDTIERSFKFFKDIETRNRVKGISEDMKIMIGNISQLRLVFIELFGRLDKYLTVRFLNKDVEDIANELLFALPKEHREKSAKKIKERFNNPIFFRRLDIIEGGYLEVNPNANHLVGPLDEVIIGLKKDCINELKKLKAFIVALKAVVADTKIKIAYNDKFIKEIEKHLRDDTNKGYFYMLSRRGKIKDNIYYIDFSYESTEVNKVEIDKIQEDYLNAWYRAKK